MSTPPQTYKIQAPKQPTGARCPWMLAFVVSYFRSSFVLSLFALLLSRNFVVSYLRCMVVVDGNVNLFTGAPVKRLTLPSRNNYVER